MAVLESRMMECGECGAEVPVSVYRTKVQLLRELVAGGKLDDLSPQDVEGMFAEEQETDEREQEAGYVEVLARIAEEGGAVFVDGRKEQAVCCPHCGGLLCTMSRPRYG